MTDHTTRNLCAKGLNKRYGSQQVLHDLNLTIEPGHIYGLIGRNGAGKTTLLSILTGQNPLTSGQVTYGGEPVWENPRALARQSAAQILPLASDGQRRLKASKTVPASSAFARSSGASLAVGSSFAGGARGTACMPEEASTPQAAPYPSCRNGSSFQRSPWSQPVRFGT